MILIIRKEAEQDISSAIHWYNQQQIGVGDSLLTEIYRLFEQIIENPRIFPEVRTDIHRALTHRFPYAVYYQPTANKITIHAVLHQKRSPLGWSDR
jgi:plasmid stabilization system protein ParE